MRQGLGRLRRAAMGLGMALGLVLGGCAARPEQATSDPRPFAVRTPQPLLPMPRNTPPELPFTTAEALLPKIEALYPKIGGWPPAYASAAERTSLYAEWTQLLNVARVLEAQEQGSEPSRYALAELYRLGHNLDVAESGVEAQRRFRACIDVYPQTIACHFTAIRYYLAVAPLQLDLAERSLTALRARMSPEFNEEVERGYAFLHVYRNDPVAAGRQIADYLALFPQSPMAPTFRLMQQALRQGKSIVTDFPEPSSKR